MDSNTKKSKYISNKREESVFQLMAVLFLVAQIVMPPYFGIPVPGFDLTAIRMMIIVLLFLICIDKDKLYDFWRLYEEAAVNCFAPEVRSVIRGALGKLDGAWENLRL